MNITANLLLILTIGSGGEDVKCSLYRYIRNEGHASSSNIFWQIKYVLAIIVKGHPVIISTKLF